MLLYCMSVQYSNTLSCDYSTNMPFYMCSAFSAAPGQMRNEGGLKASFASVSSALKLVYWLVWLSCLTVFTCSHWMITVNSLLKHSKYRDSHFVSQCWSKTKMTLKSYDSQSGHDKTTAVKSHLLQWSNLRFMLCHVVCQYHLRSKGWAKDNVQTLSRLTHNDNVCAAVLQYIGNKGQIKNDIHLSITEK